MQIVNVELSGIEIQGWERPRARRGCVRIWSAWWGCVVLRTCGGKNGRVCALARAWSRSGLARMIVGLEDPVGSTLLS